MKKIQSLLVAACSLCAVAAMAQQDFSGPQYAKWGDTPEEREKNILNSNFLKESYENKDFNAAAHYLQELINSCPGASVAIYQRGANVYKNKINRAKSMAEKNMYIDSLMLIYDLRLQYFGDSPRQGAAFILDQKAREYLTYRAGDRAGIRKAFRAAIEAGGAATNPETLVAYYSNLCDDFKNTDEVTPDEVIAEYDRLLPYFGEDAAEYKGQFDTVFGKSGAASCEALENIFRVKLEADPDNEELLAQAVSLMSRPSLKCNSDFYLAIAEKYYEVSPSAGSAMSLAQAFQERRDYTKATHYLNEALAVEQNPENRQALYVQIALVELLANHLQSAAAAARAARDLNPEDGQPYFILAQCYAFSAAQCEGFAGQAIFWVAYDTMTRALSLLPADSDYIAPARSSLASYRNHFPTSEECFFNEAKEGSSYTVSCGLAAGQSTTVRFR
ncbi:MAG: enzyme of heme biosynthesis [Alistipes sp.]|nr:enzyme of heme biosynthesis [Alistipes senegalensis]MCM1250956.1 enzyme of heme biosynthesis [Alistipes sp.]